MKKKYRSIYADKMLELYLSGSCLNKIGKRYGITRERVRQILCKKYPLVYGNAKGNYKIGKRITYTCANKKCKKVFTILKSARNRRVCCSSDCFIAYKYDIRLNTKKRTCTKCGKTKLIHKFYDILDGRRNGRAFKMAHCKKCHEVIVKNWGKRNPELKRKIQRDASKRYLKNNYKKVRDNFKLRYRTDKKFRERILAYNRVKSKNRVR